MLDSDDKRFEVVISDDASSDNTQELLSAIHDSRFRYYRNDKNLGVHKNWERSLSLGRGEWLYFSMGREVLHGDKMCRLFEFLDFARENNITYMKDGYYTQESLKVFSGINAMSTFLRVTHPTADIYNGEIFRDIPNRRHYFEISDMFPENYIRRDMLMKGNGAFINSEIYIRHESFTHDKMAVKSTVEHDKNIYDMYFAPRRLIVQHKELIDMILKDSSEKFSKSELDKYFAKKFYELVNHVSRAWKSWCRNDSMSMHYGYKMKHVSRLEMLLNILKAYRAVKSHLKQHKIYSLRRQIIMYRILVKIFIEQTGQLAKKFAKILLEPLGIWKILKAIKNFPRSH